MPSSSQEPRGPGLSSSLVSDFRAIMNSLEQEKSGRGPDEAGPIIISAKPAARPAAPTERPQARPAPEAARSYGEVRERLNALGDVGDMLAKRGTAAPGTSTPGGKADASEAAKRKRGFGTSARQPGEAEMRRKRGAPKDVITWQRLGVLAIFVAMVGGGVVALQSLAAREEAKVAPEVIGNAAVASVAPSAPASVALAAAPAETPAPARAVVPQSTNRQAATSQPAAGAFQGGIAASLPPVLRDAPPPFEIASTTPPGVTAFASSSSSAAPSVEPAMAAAKPLALPDKVPLPPRAPTRHAAATTADSTAEDAADEADSRTGFGGAPIGSATIRSTVTMRAAPRRGAAPVGNLSAGEKVELVACRGWCEVISDGKRGFIYKSFVDAASSARAEAAADAPTTAQ